MLFRSHGDAVADINKAGGITVAGKKLQVRLVVAVDESSEGNGRFYDELTATDATKAATDQQTFTVYLPVQL